MSSKELKQALPGLLTGHRLTADQTNKQQCPDMPLRAEQMLSHLKRNPDFSIHKSRYLWLEWNQWLFLIVWNWLIQLGTRWSISPAANKGSHGRYSSRYSGYSRNALPGMSARMCLIYFSGAWFFRRKNTVIPAKRKPRVRSMETVSPVTRKPLQK